jgi:hypothetical protein
MRGKVCTITEIVLKVLCTTGLIFLGMNFFMVNLHCLSQSFSLQVYDFAVTINPNLKKKKDSFFVFFFFRRMGGNVTDVTV